MFRLCAVIAVLISFHCERTLGLPQQVLAGSAKHRQIAHRTWRQRMAQATAPAFQQRKCGQGERWAHATRVEETCVGSGNRFARPTQTDVVVPNLFSPPCHRLAHSAVRYTRAQALPHHQRRTLPEQSALRAAHQRTSSRVHTGAHSRLRSVRKKQGRRAQQRPVARQAQPAIRPGSLHATAFGRPSPCSTQVRARNSRHQRMS